ncbi:peptidase [Streptomyces sp. NPDC007205]|uniref:peptidase n=1 Tax=Streptomyces sp. NPDC007205 TaxID=3154316 RepID=UPI0033D36009
MFAGISTPNAQAVDVSDSVTGSGTLTLAQIAAMQPPAQSRILDPLRKLAAALDTAGKKAEADVYSTVRIDAPRGIVHVSLTNPADGPKVIRAALKVDRNIDVHRIAVERAPYTLKQLHTAREKLLAQAASHQLPYHVYTVAVATDGSSLQIGVDKPATAQAHTPLVHTAVATGSTPANILDGVAVTFQQGEQPRPTDQASIKWDDSSPQIGGDVITDGDYYCTTGLPAVTSANVPVMITANHCFQTGRSVYTAGGAHPAFGKYYTSTTGALGSYVGKVTGNSGAWDAEELTGGHNNSDVQLSDTWHPVTSAAYSHTGDLVCQAGGASYFMGYGNVCGIEVTNQDITYSLNDWSGTHNVRGVEGTRLASNQPWVNAEGDSGGMVYSVSGSTYQARGVDSAGSGPCCYARPDTGKDVAFNYIFWTEAPDILGRFGLKLNPAR